LDLIQNIALLVMMAVAYRILYSRWREASFADQLVLGLLFGGVALVGMATPVEVLPGVIFDGRSIIMGVAGLVGGPLVALVAGLLAAGYRYALGGAGTAMGVGVVVEAGVLGALLHAFRRRSGRPLGFVALWFFGLAIHALMLALVFTLPEPARGVTLVQVGPAILLVYPVATMLVCRLFLDYEGQQEAQRALTESRERMDLALRGADLGTWDRDVWTGRMTLNARWAEMLGYALEEIEPTVGSWEALMHPEDLPRAKALLDAHLAGESDLYEAEVRLRHKAGHWVWVLDRGRVTGRDASGRPLRAAGTHLDITERKAAAEEFRRQGERVRQQNQTLLGLMMGGGLFRDGLPDSLQQITEAASGLVGTERVGIWWYSDDRSRLRCLDLYVRTSNTHRAGAEVDTEGLPECPSDRPAGEILSVSDVSADPLMERLVSAHGNEVGFTSFIAAPIWVHGTVGGLLSFGHAGEPRVWGPDDERLAATMATLVSLCVETSDRRRAEEALQRRVDELALVEEDLRKSEAFTRAVMDHLPIGIAVNSTDPGVAAVYMNRLFPTLYRTTTEELPTPDAFWEAAYEDPAFREELKKRVVEDVASGDPDQMHWEDVAITRVGEDTTFVNARNVPVPGTGLMISTVWDVTHRKLTEEALRESEARFRRLTENAPDIIFRYRLLPVEERGFEYVSPVATKITGFTPEEHYARPELRREMVHPEDRDRLVIPTAPGPADPVVLRWIRKDRGLVWMEIRNVPVHDAHGNVVAVEGIARDVTGRMRHEREINALAESLELKVQERTHQLRAANAELESFSYSVSHDLKAPLRAIDGYSALLQETGAPGLDDEGRRLVQEIRTNARQMGRLIEDLLAFSRVSRATLSREVVHLGPIIQEIIDRERRLAPDRRIELEVGDLPAVQGDLILLRQALDNILGNAVKFTGPREVARIEVTAERTDSSVQVAVRDNGVGFDPTYQHKLFRVFERLHYQDEFEGTGVGLAIVKRIVDRHRGRVTAESELGLGTVIHLTLPGAQEA
jgi:PAS domain S-box-containing protein